MNIYRQISDFVPKSIAKYESPIEVGKNSIIDKIGTLVELGSGN